MWRHVAQERERLAVGPPHLHHHEGLAVPAQRVLQQVGEPRVPEGHVGVAAAQRVDDVAQRRQRLVDALRLAQAAALRARLGDAL